MQLEDVTSTPLPRLPARAADSHKGDFGRALLIGGSRGMSGAICLAGLATLRSGAGLVTLAVPQCIQDVVASNEPSYMTFGLNDRNAYMAPSASGTIGFLSRDATAVGLGPGMGRAPWLVDFVHQVYHHVDKPMVIDADALYGLARKPDAPAGGPRILTPHPGEFARLDGQPIASKSRIAAAADFIHSWAQIASAGLIVVLKGHETVITDGGRYSINHTGNPGMATGGTGDVLTGVITALLCQGLSPFDAARLGVHVHGLAGDLAATDLGQVSLIASDVIDYLPKAFLSLENSKS